MSSFWSWLNNDWSLKELKFYSKNNKRKAKKIILLILLSELFKQAIKLVSQKLNYLRGFILLWTTKRVKICFFLVSFFRLEFWIQILFYTSLTLSIVSMCSLCVFSYSSVEYWLASQPRYQGCLGSNLGRRWRFRTTFFLIKALPAKPPYYVSHNIQFHWRR